MDAATELAKGLAHELGNALTTMRFAAVNLRGAWNGTAGLAFLESIERQIERVERDTSAMLECIAPSRAHERVRLQNAIGEVAEDIVLSGSDPWIRVDVTAFRAALMALIDNARAAAPESSPIEVRIVEEPTQVRVAVSDRGAPISEPLRDKIFRMFFSTKGRRGLGLSRVLWFCHNHRGTVRYVPEPLGNTFELVLPTDTESADSR